MTLMGVQLGRVDVIDGEALKKLWQLKGVVYVVPLEKLQDITIEELLSRDITTNT